MLIIVDYSFRHCFLLAFGGSTTSVVLSPLLLLGFITRHRELVWKFLWPMPVVLALLLLQPAARASRLLLLLALVRMKRLQRR